MSRGEQPAATEGYCIRPHEQPLHRAAGAPDPLGMGMLAVAEKQPSVQGVTPGVAATNRSKAMAKPSTIDSWSGTKVLSQAMPTTTSPL